MQPFLHTPWLKLQPGVYLIMPDRIAKLPTRNLTSAHGQVACLDGLFSSESTHIINELGYVPAGNMANGSGRWTLCSIDWFGSIIKPWPRTSAIFNSNVIRRSRSIRSNFRSTLPLNMAATDRHQCDR